MPRNVASALDKIQENLELQQKKLEYLRENMLCIEYWDSCGEGAWKPFTEEVALCRKWNVDELRVNAYYLVKTDLGVLLLTKEEYETFIGDTYVICQGSYQYCKDFIKVK